MDTAKLFEAMTRISKSLPTLTLAALLPGEEEVRCWGPAHIHENLRVAARAFSSPCMLEHSRALFRLGIAETDRTSSCIMLERFPMGVVLAGSYAAKDPVSKSLRRAFRQAIAAATRASRVQAEGGKSARTAQKAGAAHAKSNPDQPAAI